MEHSAILISKILKASNGHLSFDGWYGPLPPIVMSQQRPAPAGPPETRNEGTGNIRRPVGRFLETVRHRRVSYPTTQTKKETCRSNFKGAKMKTDITVQRNVTVLTFHHRFAAFMPLLI